MSNPRAPRTEDEVFPVRRPSPFARFLTGLMAFSAGVFICGACGSYSPTDPSLNSAVMGEAANLFGRPGALGADLLTQAFGWTAWLMGFALMIGGLRRTLGIGPREPAAWLWGMSALVLSACCLSEWPIPQSWPLAAGLGGAMGDVLLAIASTPFAALRAPDAEIWAAALAGVCSILFAAMAMGLGASDGAALLRAFRARRQAEAEAHAAEAVAVVGGGMSLLSRLPMLALPNPFRKKQADIIEPIVVTADDDFEDGDRGFFNAVEKAEGVGGRSIPITPRVLESRPIPDPAAPARPGVKPPVMQMPAAAAAPKTPAAPTVSHNASTAIPPIELLDVPPPRRSEVDEARLLDMADRLQGVFNDFKVKGRIVEVRPGPVVTLFELEPAPGVKSSQVIGLADDIARSMSATAARVAVIPGRNAIGIELPNPSRETVYLRDLLNAQEFRRTRSALPLALGESIEGQPTIADLGKMPHLLIAGTTGSGKSVGINAMILSLMFKLPPEKCRFIMIDPKMLELSIYEGIPHLLSPVVTDPAKAVLALKWVVREMESRYELMSKMGVRNIAGYNQKAEDATSKGEYISRQVQTGWDKETGEAIWETEQIKPEQMPHIVVIIDEVADLMMVAGKDIEACVQRLAQMARAAGIHLIMATQRPSVDVITGTIKANFPTRISYQVTSKIDSRTILGEQGAEQLLGMGDLLWMASGGKIVRVHGPFVKDEEVERVVTWLKDQGTPQYVQGVTDDFEQDEASVADAAFGTSSGDPEEDMYREAVTAVVRDKRPTTSYVQRVLRIGYNRAASMIERMEREGIISAADHSGKRQIIPRDGHGGGPRGEEAA
ncbi:MAG: DNA translocase FtsK 4TM domain-containing protein [Alphaproteobacteria bacterium]